MQYGIPETTDVMAEARRLQGEHGAALLRSIGRKLRHALTHPAAALAVKPRPQLGTR